MAGPPASSTRATPATSPGRCWPGAAGPPRSSGCLDEPRGSARATGTRAAENPTSGAYGIPQALPAVKMAAAGSDWETNPATQIEWGLAYIAGTYGSPCAANSFKLSNGWY